MRNANAVEVGLMQPAVYCVKACHGTDNGASPNVYTASCGRSAVRDGGLFVSRPTAS